MQSSFSHFPLFSFVLREGFIDKMKSRDTVTKTEVLNTLIVIYQSITKVVWINRNKINNPNNQYYPHHIAHYHQAQSEFHGLFLYY